jgi:hypothetical protein
MKNAKFSQRNNQSKIAVIVKKVKNFEFRKKNDLRHAKAISADIVEEWSRLMNCYDRILDRKKFNINLAAEYEVQQQMIFCLMCLLNEKMFDFLESIL